MESRIAEPWEGLRLGQSECWRCQSLEEGPASLCQYYNYQSLYTLHCTVGGYPLCTVGFSGVLALWTDLVGWAPGIRGGTDTVGGEVLGAAHHGVHPELTVEVSYHRESVVPPEVPGWTVLQECNIPRWTKLWRKEAEILVNWECDLFILRRLKYTDSVMHCLL